MTSLKVLIVDDCVDALDLIQMELAADQFDVVRASDGAEAWLAFQDEAPDAVVTDVRMPDADGFDLLRRVRKVSDVPLVLLTAYAEVSAAVSAMRSGADDYLCYPDDLERLAPLVRELVRKRGLAFGDVAETRLAGRSKPIAALRQRLRRLAPLRSPLWISGEPGTGRGLAALVVHELAEEAAPLHVLDPAEPMLPSQPGVVLLRDFDQFEAQEQRRWSSEHHRVRAGSSLFHRLLFTAGPVPASAAPPIPTPLWREVSNFVIEMPPLRDRPEDLELLAQELARGAARQLGCGPVRLAPEALEVLAAHPWPGNVADLEAVLEKAVAFHAGGFIGPAAIEESLRMVIGQKSEGLAKRRAARHGEERMQLVELLSQCGGNVAEMGRRMGLTRGAVAYRLKKHGLAS